MADEPESEEPSSSDKLSRYTVNSSLGGPSIYTVHSSPGGPSIYTVNSDEPSLDDTLPSIVTMESSKIDKKLQSTHIHRADTSNNPSILSESTIEPCSDPTYSSGSDVPSSSLRTTGLSNGSSTDPTGSTISPPSTDPSDPSESNELSTHSSDDMNVTEMGPHKADDVTQYIYDERQCLAHLNKLPTAQWFSSHLLCQHVDEAHKWLTVSIITLEHTSFP